MGLDQLFLSFFKSLFSLIPGNFILFLNAYLFLERERERERERARAGEGQRERKRKSPKLAPCCQHKAQRGA